MLMRSCIEWRKSFPYMVEIDQFNIDYKLNKTKELISFLDVFGMSQRVNIRIDKDIFVDEKEDLIDLFIDLVKLDKYMFAIVIDQNFFSEEEVQKLRENNVLFYFNSVIDTWDDLLGIVSLGVSDIFIGRDLCFELDKIKAALQFLKKSVQIRVYANICQTFYDYDDGLKTFFIRPEDMEFYSTYIDIIEFYDSADIQKVLYEIYFHDQKWNGNLQEIIKGLKVEINNEYFLTGDFAEQRAVCGRKCLKGKRCALCDKLVLLAKTIKNSDDYEMFSKYHSKGDN